MKYQNPYIIWIPYIITYYEYPISDTIGIPIVKSRSKPAILSPYETSASNAYMNLTHPNTIWNTWMQPIHEASPSKYNMNTPESKTTTNRRIQNPISIHHNVPIWSIPIILPYETSLWYILIFIPYKYLSNFHNSRLYCLQQPPSPSFVAAHTRDTSSKIPLIRILKSIKTPHPCLYKCPCNVPMHVPMHVPKCV